MSKENNCAGSYPVSAYTRADGTKVSGYTRTCGAAHTSTASTTGYTSADSKISKKEQIIRKEEAEREKMQRRADILYPTMSDKKVSEVEQERNENFFTALNFVYKNEGGYSNDKDDKGGATNFGVTQTTYDDYCRRNNLTSKNVKDLTREETVRVYYEEYWKKSGADDTDNIFEAIVLFDTAVLHGVGRAKSYAKKANGNPFKILSLRREHYQQKVKKDKTQMKFFNGWNNRTNRLEKMLNRAKEAHLID